MLLSGAIMLISLILVGFELTEDSKFQIANISGDLAMFVFGLILFFIHWRNDRNNKTNQKINE